MNKLSGTTTPSKLMSEKILTPDEFQNRFRTYLGGMYVEYARLHAAYEKEVVATNLARGAQDSLILQQHSLQQRIAELEAQISGLLKHPHSKYDDEHGTPNCLLCQLDDKIASLQQQLAEAKEFAVMHSNVCPTVKLQAENELLVALLKRTTPFIAHCLHFADMNKKATAECANLSQEIDDELRQALAEK